MVMNGFDTNFDRSNEVYAVNSVAFAYMAEPVQVKRGELVRIYLVNALEFDLVNSFHIHANFFDYYPTGTRLEPRDFTDTVIQGQGERGILELRFPYAGKYMFHAHVSRVRRARLDGLLRGHGVMEAAAPPVRRPPWLAGLIPVVVLAVAIGLFVALDAPGLDRIGVPQEELAVERTVLKPGEIELHVRNDGADPVRIEQAIVNDAFASFSQTDEEIGRLGGGEVKIVYPWIEGESYEVMLLTSTGATIDHAIDAAVETPDADLGFYGLMALIGLYVGVIPVAIGMLWLPWLRRVDARWVRFLLAFTVGLLAFLAIEALLEGTELAGEGPQAFGGAALVWLGAAAAYLALSGVDAWLRGRAERAARDAPARTRPASASARPCWSRSGSGCTTSARASRSARPTRSGRSRSAPRSSSASRSTTPRRASPSSRRSPAPARRGCARSCCWACSPARPAVLGAWIGASAFHPSVAAVMFGIGAGAIAQVIVQIAPSMRGSDGRLLNPLSAGGLATGLLVMYATGLLVSV